MRYAAAHPSRVRGLSLLASLPPRGADWQLPTQAVLRQRFLRPRALAEFRRMGIDIWKSDTATRVRSLEHRIAKGAAYLHNPQLWPALAGTLFYNSAASTAAGLAPANEDLTPALSRLSIPIQVLFPDDDYLPTAISTRWVRKVPNAHLTIIQNAGHVFWIDNPKSLERYLGCYLDLVTRKKSPSITEARC